MGCYVPDDGPLIVLTVWTSPTEIGQVDTEVDCFGCLVVLASV